MAKCVSCGKSGMLLKVNAAGVCRDCETANMQRQISELASPEYRDLEMLRSQIAAAQAELADLNNQLIQKRTEFNSIHSLISQKRSELVEVDEQILLQSFGLYTPKFNFVTVDRYKQELDKVREQEKVLIKNGGAVTGLTNWQVNGNAAQGRKMVADMQKLLLRAFNTECDELVAKVRYNNIEASVKRINASCEAISKLGKIMQIAITPGYLNLKIKEIYLAFEYAQVKEKEKEEQREARARQREELKVQKELEEKRQKLLREQTQYANAIAKLDMMLASDPDNTDVLVKRAELAAKFQETEKAIADVDYRAANIKIGHVYVISNIGSFGEGVYKIGMTRRIDPYERITELSDASVPFNFDVHAMIFTEDAPGLEAALHRAFEDRKVNLVNHRREFFRVPLNEIKAEILKNYDKTVEFEDLPQAEQYYQSEAMRNTT